MPFVRQVQNNTEKSACVSDTEAVKKECIHIADFKLWCCSSIPGTQRVLAMLLYVLVTVSLLVGGSWCADIGLPIHLNHDDQSEADEQIKLEDFFWTGSGDGPPDYLKQVHTGISKGKDVIVKTETIVATVYVEGKNDVDTICLDCTKDPTYLPINYTTTDRRYWLLTVVSGYFRPSDYPLLEDKLAKLYRLAFTRQQSRHLGLTNNNHYSMERDNSTRNKRQVTSNTSSVDKNKSLNKTTEKDLKRNQSQLHPILPSHIKMPSAYLHAQLLNQSNSPEKNPLNNTVAVAIAKKDKENQRVISNYPYPLDQSDHHVRVVIHNVTLITEDDIQAWDEDPYYNSDSSDKSSRPFANQTELVYTVFVNGKPVLATTAAEDMKLVTENEMSAIMEKRVFMKAEPYLKEPQATPLVPATKSEGRGFFAAISHNPVLVAISSIAILLLLLLLIALLLMTRAKRQRSAEVKRLSSRQGLLIEHQNIHEQDSSRTPRGGGLDDTRDDFNEGGVHNMGYEHDPRSHKRHKKPANIDFPQPPASRPSSSGTSTSDSSVYCPINRPNIDLQNMLDEKASRLFDKKKRGSRVQAEEATEPFYTSVARKREKKTKLKQKRRYLSENRVGSIEEKQARSTDSSNSNESIPDTLKPQYDQLEPNEAYNPNNNYHRNKIMQNDVFVDDGYTDTIKSITSPTQAINREIIKALQHGEKSSESGSIGSFLSMASVKSFPRSTLPEPLHRVLEPVSVTYYDHYDDSTILRKPKSLNAEPKSNKSGVSTPMVSQSDTPDPGVIGPIVWEIHKKNRLVSQKSEFIDSPIHDPALSRNRYEGLLEGAIQLYSNQDDTIPPLPSNSFGNSSIRLKDTRGKSAIVASNPHRLPRSNSDTRPLTAGPNKTHSNQSTQPPSPNSRAWGSGAPSPLVRPLSAGPFHRPDPPVVDVTRVLAPQPGDRSNLSAAPLIEAIQNELQKFKRENSQ